MTKRLGWIVALTLFLVPDMARAATATYTNTASLNLPSNREQAVEIVSALEVPDGFTISDVNLSWTIMLTNLGSMTAVLKSPAGTEVVVYERQVSGRNMIGTTFDDEAGRIMRNTDQPWRLSYIPRESLSAFDGESMQGTWTLTLSFLANPDGTGSHGPNSSSSRLEQWTLTAEGADPATIEGYKYQDVNANGQKDSNETGLSDWTIFLDKNNNRVLDGDEESTTTNTDGFYQFSNLALADYVVREVEESGWIQIIPGTKAHEVRTRNGTTASDINFANIPVGDTEETIYRNETLTLIPQTESTTVTSTIEIEDPRSVADVNVTLRLLGGSNLGDLDIGLTGPNGQRVELTRQEVNGANFGNTTFDDESNKDLNDDGQAWTGSYQPNQPLGVFNAFPAQGVWMLDVTDTELGGAPPARLEFWNLTVRTPINVAPPEPDPVVIVPALAASFNPATTLADVNTNQWDFAPTADLFYQGLVDRFVQQGFVENQDLFVAHYDWRKPVDEAAENYLKPVIDQAKSTSVSGKVDIVAHSMGGLVSRAYIQGDNYENDVDQLILLGTPNEGAADAYVAWEGGLIPERWSEGLRLYLVGVENALRVRRATPIPRPGSFRTFFPSLQDLLPVHDFVTHDGSPLATTDLTAQNDFLQQLKADLLLMGERGVRTTTIAGNEIPTLHGVILLDFRTPLDAFLDRWRDGRPHDDPPQADTNQGDQTVLISSALLGTDTITISQAEHDDLPEEGQEEVLVALGLDASGDHIHYEKPTSLLGLEFLSPIVPTISTPEGNQFVCDHTKRMGSFHCVVDETDPKGPKLLVVEDPEPGTYQSKLTGTGSGEYHAITCFADADEDGCTVREGETNQGKIETYSFTITPDSFRPPVEDVTNLICQLPDTIRDLMFSRHLKPRAFKLHGFSTRTCSFAKNWQKEADKKKPKQKNIDKWYNRTKSDFERFSEELNEQIEDGNVDETAAKALLGLQERIAL